MCVVIILDCMKLQRTRVANVLNRVLASTLAFKAMMLTIFFMIYIIMRGVLGYTLSRYESYEKAVEDELFITIRQVSLFG